MADSSPGAMDQETVQEHAKQAMEDLDKLSGPVHIIELHLQHIWVNAGGDPTDRCAALYPDDELTLTAWLEEQKGRAEERMVDDELDPERRAEWKGEHQLIYSIQKYLEAGVLELE